tara:strand:- start:296 stop:484 length:189 start_codon:yes stop_codon:yes gene_type:complete
MIVGFVKVVRLTLCPPIFLVELAPYTENPYEAHVPDEAPLVKAVVKRSFLTMDWRHTPFYIK